MNEKTSSTDRSAVRFLSKLTPLLAGAFCFSAAFAQETVIHNFTDQPSDGRLPGGGMTLADNVFYGTTSFGGAHSEGSVYRMNADGTGYALVHSFSSSGTDGSNPFGRLLVVGSTIYGTTASTIYSMDTSGGNLVVLHTFTGGTNDGSSPTGYLTLVGSTLYGVTELGGMDNLGTIFKVDVAGSGFGILHQFATGKTDGHLPFGGLTLSGSTLFGTTSQGGTSNFGTIFKIDVSGSGYALMRQFTGTQDPYNVEKSLTLIGPTLYGVSNQGGAAGTGSIFKINTDGTGYAVIYSFDGTSGTDGHPSSALTLFQGHLVGTTDPIDARFPAIIYSVGLDGGGFATLYQFNGATTQGREPGGSLALINDTLYGTTGFGGAGNGVVYAFSLPSLTMTSISRDNNGATLTGHGLPKSPVVMEASDDLASEFIPIGNTTADANGSFSYPDAQAKGLSTQFYRAVYPYDY